MDVIHPLACDALGVILMYQPKTRVDLTKEMGTVLFAYEHADNFKIYQETVQSLLPGVLREDGPASLRTGKPEAARRLP